MVAPATTDEARDPVTIDHERVLWDAEYRREVAVTLAKRCLQSLESKA